MLLFESDVCRVYTSGLSREQRGLGRPIGREVAHVTRDSDKSRSSGRLTAALTREACAAVRTCWAWKTTTTLRLLGGARGAGAPTGGGEWRGHIVSPRAQLVITNGDWQQ